MSDAYKKVKAGRLTFKGGELSSKKKSNKRKKNKSNNQEAEQLDPSFLGEDSSSAVAAVEGGGVDEGAGGDESSYYTIDAAKRMKYEELFPVEAKKFGYDPANKSRSNQRSVEEALDDRVKKKADRYCK